MTSRIWPIMRKEFLEIWRDTRSLAFVLVMPVLMLLLYGYGISSDVKRVPLAVYDRDGQPPARELVRRFTSTEYFVEAVRVGSLRELRQATLAGLWAFLGEADLGGCSSLGGEGRIRSVELRTDGTRANHDLGPIG